jgi:hypothetical protein
MIEIAAVCKCSVDTLENRFSDIIKEGRETGKMSLRRLQFKAAEKGNPAILIWLGKQHLDQKDVRHLSIEDLSDEEFAREAVRRRERYKQMGPSAA